MNVSHAKHSEHFPGENCLITLKKIRKLLIFRNAIIHSTDQKRRKFRQESLMERKFSV